MRPIAWRTSLAALASMCTVACMGNGDDRPSPPAVTAVGGIDASRGDASKGLDATAGVAESGAQDAATGDAVDVEVSTPTLALVRLANWSADAPAVDFCLGPHGSGAFGAPILGATAASIDEAGIIDAGSGALPFPQTSAYLLVQPAQYDVRLVAAGSINCATGITDDGTLPALSAGGLETIALVGAAHPQHGEPALEIVGFVDELESSLAGALIIRVINAAADLPKIEIGMLADYFTPFLSAVSFGASSAGDPMADSNGYVSQLPVMNQTIAARTAAASRLDASVHTIVAQAPNVSLSNGLSVTFVVVGASGQLRTDGGSPLGQLLECIDNAGTVGLEGTCRVISQ